MILDGKKVSTQLLQELEERFLKIKTGICVIEVGNNFASKRYIEQKRKVARRLGVEFRLLSFLETTTEELCMEIDKLNEDASISGILIQLPLNDKIDYDVVRNRISPLKDVEGVTDFNLGKIISGNAFIIPCTALGIIKLLNYYEIKLEGLDVCIIGRSIHIGKVLLHLLEANNCTVSLCHSKTKNLSFYTKNSDIVITCVGKSGFLKKEMIREDAIIIDVGFNYANGKICGDVDSEIDKFKALAPVPGGVGPMTVCAVYENLYKLYKA